MRARAIYCALSYGVRPWWMYEGRCHYAPMTYGAHLRMNLAYAWRWIARRETAEDVAFECEVNGAPEDRALTDAELGRPADLGAVVRVHVDGRQIADVAVDATSRR